MKREATWRLLDTGERGAAENMALDAVLLDGRMRDFIPSTLHYLQFSPPSALVGYHQSVEQEVHLAHCRERGIEVNRRLTGGGAIYLDGAQLGWGLICRRDELRASGSLSEITAEICRGVVAGIRRLGVEAQFRPRNDIEVRGRKLSGTGGVFQGDILLYQGTLLMDLDLEAMGNALMISAEKLSARELGSLRDRLTCLKEELGEPPRLEDAQKALQQGFQEVLGVRFEEGGLTPWEEKEIQERIDEFRSEEWIHTIQEPPQDVQWLRGNYKASGGLIRLALRVDLERQILKQVILSGDFFVHPRRLILDLEAWLRNTPLVSLKENLALFFSRQGMEMLGLEQEDFLHAIEQALISAQTNLQYS